MPQVKLCTRGSCCPTLNVDFDEDIVTFIDDDNRVSNLSCDRYEKDFRSTDFESLHVVVLEDGETKEPACISPEEYRLSWTEYWRMKLEYLAAPKI